MKYCTKCKKVCSDSEKTLCPVCSKEMISDPSHYSPVNIVTANGFELERIKAALKENNIPFTVQEAKADTGLQILNSAPLENSCVFVPLSFYNQAVELLMGIGAIKEADEINEEDEKKLIEERESEDGEMSPRKRRLVKILSALAFIALLAAVVFLADFLGRLINPYFH